MKIYIKGLIKYKLIKKYMFIIFVILLAINSLSCISVYLKNKEKIELEKPEYRTLIFTSETITESIIDKYKESIENYVSSDEYYEIIFNSKEELEKFKQDNSLLFKNLINTLPVTNQISQRITLMLAIMIILSKILLLILLIVFSTNYLISITKEIALYSIIGYSKLLLKTTLSAILLSTYLLIDFFSIIIVNIVTFLSLNYKVDVAEYSASILIIFASIIIVNLVYLITAKNKKDLEALKE